MTEGKSNRTISRDAFNKAMEEARKLVRVGVTAGIGLTTTSKTNKETKKGKAEKL